MQLKLDDLKSPVFLTGIAVVLGTVFQFGYFRHIGTEFIYLLGPTDWIISLMILSLPIFTVGAVTVYLCHWLGEGFTIAASTKFGRFIFSLPVLLIWYFSFVALTNLQKHYPASGPWIAVGIGLLLVAITVFFLRSLLDGDEIDFLTMAVRVWRGSVTSTAGAGPTLSLVAEFARSNSSTIVC